MDCTDDNPCTIDSCSDGVCVHTTIDDPCCDGSMSAALAGMASGIEALVDAEGLTANLELHEPSVSESGVSADFVTYDSDGLARVATTSAGCGTGGNSLRLFIDTEEVNSNGDTTARWSLSLDLWEDGDVLHMFGTLDFIDIAGSGSGSLVGGWTYSDAEGAALDPASDPGFQDEVARMLNIGGGGEGGTAAAAIGLGTALQFLGNLTQLAINYALDVFIPFAPPEEGTCSGPSVDSTCSSDQPPCKDSLADLCEEVGDIPEVSTAFKQCMKGRCGCGGSHHKPARVVCRATNDCGPCGTAGGCNILGSRLWYCQSETASDCLCVNTVFHEMAHACGAVHNLEYLLNGQCNDTDAACEIGEWFEDEFCSSTEETLSCCPPK